MLQSRIEIQYQAKWQFKLMRITSSAAMFMHFIRLPDGLYDELQQPYYLKIQL
jgi:hypothetical protein